jgi:hypothetical protein
MEPRRPLNANDPTMSESIDVHDRYSGRFQPIEAHSHSMHEMGRAIDPQFDPVHVRSANTRPQFDLQYVAVESLAVLLQLEASRDGRCDRSARRRISYQEHGAE